MDTITKIDPNMTKNKFDFVDPKIEGEHLEDWDLQTL